MPKKKKKIRNIILYSVLLIVIVPQFFQPDRSQPAVIKAQTFEAAFPQATELHGIMRGACYDCHSNETKYPWYAYITPVSFWLQDHIRHGSHHLNFSEWATYSAEDRHHALEEMVEEVEEGNMPLDSYVPMHKEADLTPEDRQHLVDLINALR